MDNEKGSPHLTPLDKYYMATIQELESFKLSDAVSFHEELNPQLWEDEKLDVEVRDQLLLIAEDFVEYLGISNLKVKDVTISGSNAAYSYTPHSDLDLHILVDFNDLPDNEVYQELFTAKKTLYNDTHDITVHGVPVELYVQDTNQVHTSLGEYSVVYDKWIRIPKKRRANFDEAATKAKYEKLGDLIELALKSKDSKRVNDTLALIKRYRKSGLEKAGEFGPENLAFKAVRKQGLIQKLYDLKSQLHGEKLSIEEIYSGPKMTSLRSDELKGSYTSKQQVIDHFVRSARKRGEDVNLAMRKGAAAWERGWRGPKQPKNMKRQNTDPTYNVGNVSLEEALNSPYPYEKKDDTYHFTTDKGIDYEVYFINQFRDWIEVIFEMITTDQYGDSWSHTGSSGAGDSFKVFGTVIKIVQDYVSKNSPNVIYFTAKEEDNSRVNLYKRLVSQVDKALPQYQAEPYGKWSLGGGDEIFVITKKKTKKKSNDNSLLEYRFQEVVHTNPSIATLKSLAKNNKYSAARFTITQDGTLKAADSEKFTHRDISPDYANVVVRGYITHLSGNDYSFKGSGPYDGKYDIDHPIYRKFERAGLINGNKDQIPEEPLNETTHESQLINQISKKAASVIFRMLRKKESPMADMFGPNEKRRNLERYGISAEQLGVPYVNDPVLSRVLSHAKFVVVNYNCPGSLNTLATYDIESHEITIHYPALKRAATEFGYRVEELLAKKISHELLHAVDNLKSGGKAIKVTGDYWARPYEINARFQEALLDITLGIEHVKQQGGRISKESLPKFIDSVLTRNYISQILPKSSSRYKQLVNRAYKFFEAEIDNPKKEQPLRITHRAMNFVLGKPTTELSENSQMPVTEGNVTDIGEKIKDSLGLQQFHVFERGNDIEVSSLIVGKENQGKGLGSKAMQQLIDYADRNNKRITLTPGTKDKTHGTTSRARLVQFYKSLGFKESKGRNLDYAIGAGKMYREPKSNASQTVTNESSGYIPSALQVYKNPSPKALHNLTKRTAHKRMRGLYHDGNTYWWDANDAIHAQGSKFLGIPYNYLTRMEVAVDSVSGNYYVGGDDEVPQDVIQKYDIENADMVYEASGYIPSAKEKNDPRFKTALTVDVKPDSIKKNAKAFGFKTSRAGIPPQARADGKITEALVVYAPDKKFATELEELQHICSTVKDFRARFKILESLGSKTLTENKQEFNDLCADVIRSLGSLSAKNLKVGNAYIPVQVAVHRNVVVFYDVKNNSPAHEPAEFGTLVKLDPNAALVKIGNTTYQYPFELSGANTMMMTVFLDTVEKYDQFRMMTELKFDQNLPLYKDSNDSPKTNGKRRQ